MKNPPLSPILSIRKPYLMKPKLLLLGTFASFFPWSTARALDENANQFSDVWEMLYGTTGLSPAADTDADGWTNLLENKAGTDPRDPHSFPALYIAPSAAGMRLTWPVQPGKTYQLLASPSLAVGPWSPLGLQLADGPASLGANASHDAARQFFKVEVGDADSDSDGLSDWEERAVGFDPKSPRTNRDGTPDASRLPAELAAPSVITVSVYRANTSESWPDPAILVLRRTGGLKALAVNVTWTGTATAASDYPAQAQLVKFAPGQREVLLEIAPNQDASVVLEPTETVIATVTTDSDYTVGTIASGTVSIDADSALPSPKEAARFLVQAAFGPSQDAADDADIVPENVEQVCQVGIAAWIEEQFTRPIGTLQPFVDWAVDHGNDIELYNDKKQDAWWGRAMELPKLRPDATTTQAGDPLRQRIGFALSQIFIISDRMEDLAVDPSGMARYYDMLLGHAFGNYRDLLHDVCLDPCMGLYLSHNGNQKADPVSGHFPDENFAREVMQLFSIGLWELNPDGTRKLDAQGQPIGAYTNADITQFARVFTGLSFGQAGKENFGIWPRDFHFPMAGWDEAHDLGSKQLLRGTVTPARTSSAGRTGTATLADVNAAVDNLFHHPNVGPFLGRLLIQRLVTSNPSPAYIGRVSAAFADNGQGVRGDMKAVVRAILLDPEARDYANRADPGYGKLREPFIKCVNLARAFNASSQSGWYYLDGFNIDHVQQPLNSPSVFNYYLPGYSPPGPITAAGLVAPEFQIINASSGTTAPNYFWNAIWDGLARWGVGRDDYSTYLNLDQEMALNVPPAAVNDPSPSVAALDPDALIRRLDLVLTGGTLAPANLQTIREALVRIGPGSTWDWPKKRLKLAIYLIVTSPEFAVQR